MVIMDLTDAFTTSEIFPTRDAMRRWVLDTGKANGIIVVTVRSDTTENGKGKKNKVVYGCERRGTYSRVDVGCSAGRHKTSKKCGCKFQLKAKPLSPPSSDWKLRVVYGIHNHGPHKTIFGAAIFGKFTKEERSVVEEHVSLGVKAQRSLDALKIRFKNNLSNISQLYRTRNSIRNAKRGGMTEMQLMAYVNKQWLYPHKERFCGPWTDNVRHYGNTTTNRVEAAHWALKRSLGSSGGDLCRSWESMHGMINAQINEIVDSFQKSINRIDAQHNIPFYKNLHGLVSLNALNHIAGEFDNMMDGVGSDKKKCAGCVIRVTHGLPCSCELGLLYMQGLPISLDMIDDHWKRLSLEAMDEERMKEASEGGDLSYTVEEIWRQWNDMHLEERCVWKRGLDDYVFRGTTSMVPPKHKVKIRGAPKKGKKKKEYDVKRDPSWWEHVDASLEIPTQKASKIPPRRSTQLASQVPSQVRSQLPSQMSAAERAQHDIHLVSHFPDFLQKYIDDIIDVEGDGNCGFRCISAALDWSEHSWQVVRNDLISEMDTNWFMYTQVMGNNVQTIRDSLVANPHVQIQPIEKWMSMPDTGHVIATRYQRPLVMFSPHENWTFFPLRGECVFSQSQLVCVGFINSSHWILLKLNRTSPIPPAHPSWGHYASHEARSWQHPYVGHMQLWVSFVPDYVPQTPLDYVDIT